MKRLYIILLAATLVSGCARAHARAVPDNPPLDMPPPPEHEVGSSEEVAPEPVGLPSEPARTTNIRPRQTPVPQTHTESPRPAEAKPETPPSEPPKPPASEEAPRPAAPTLHTVPAEAEGEVIQTIRATVARAQRDLGRIDYRSLSQEAREQYELAKGFIRQADDAIRVKNLPFAKTVADKAAAIAAQLGGRR